MAELNEAPVRVVLFPTKKGLALVNLVDLTVYSIVLVAGVKSNQRL